MELHHLAMIALLAVAVLAPKVGRAASRRAFQQHMAKEQRRLEARKCAREVARIERRGEFMESPPVLPETPMVTVLRRLREDKIAAANLHSTNLRSTN